MTYCITVTSKSWCINLQELNSSVFTYVLFQTVDDVDAENLQDTAQCALYAPFIFRYYKEREVKILCANICLSKEHTFKYDAFIHMAYFLVLYVFRVV